MATLQAETVEQPRAAAAPGKSNGFGEGFEALDPRIHFYLKGGGKQNFGDYLSALLCKHLLTKARTQADIFRLIGSVICETRIREDLREFLGIESGRIVYWGCGAREERPIPDMVLKNCRFHGVRGPLTRDLLGLAADAVLGDPGLLTPLIVAPHPSCQTWGKTICMPHMHDPRDPNALLAESGCEILLSPMVHPSEGELLHLIQAIASADFVLTGSLHGAILACAFGRPFAYWNTGFVDIEFKWRDFSASVGIEAEFVKNLEEGQLLYRDKIAPRLRRPRLSSLLVVAPFIPKVSAVLAALHYDGLLTSSSTESEIAVAARNFDDESAVRWQRFDADKEKAGLWSRLSLDLLRFAGAWRERVKRPAKRLLHV